MKGNVFFDEMRLYYVRTSYVVKVTQRAFIIYCMEFKRKIALNYFNGLQAVDHTDKDYNVLSNGTIHALFLIFFLLNTDFTLSIAL